MLLLTMIFAALVFTACRYRHLPVGRALHQLLIASPAAWLTKTPPRRLLILAVLLVGAAVVFMELAPLLVAADIAPALWFADMTLYLDGLLLAALASAAAHVRASARLLTTAVRRLSGVRAPRPRARSRAAAPRRARRLPPANDDEPAWAVRSAA